VDGWDPLGIAAGRPYRGETKASGKRINDFARWSHGSRKYDPSFVVTMTAIVIGSYLFLAAASFWKQSHELASDVQGGSAIGGAFDITSWHSALRLFNNPLGLRVDRVRVIQQEGEGSHGLHLQSRTSLLYLGQSGGIAVFFDSFAKVTLRVPAAGLVICRRDEMGSCATFLTQH
jgi:hypothetical protein